MTMGLRVATEQPYASTTGGWLWKFIVVALVAKPTRCTTLPAALGAVLFVVPAVVARNKGPGVKPDTAVFVPSKYTVASTPAPTADNTKPRFFARSCGIRFAGLRACAVMDVDQVTSSQSLRCGDR